MDYAKTLSILNLLVDYKRVKCSIIMNESVKIYLAILLQVYEQEAMPSMIDSGNSEDRIEDLRELLQAKT